MTVALTIGRFAGKSAAYAWEGTRLASSQLAQGAKEGYAEKAAELRARRAELSAKAPAVVVQKKLRTQAA